MKKELLLTGMLLTCTLIKSQVGINTQNPQGIFNIDGSKNNPATGVPTAAQMADDLVMTSNGNLGLGTTTPDTKLTISTPDNSFGFNHTNGTINLKSFVGSGYASFGTSTNNDLRFTANNFQTMSLTATGNVGIGTMTPDTKLTISTPDNSFGFNHTNGTINLKSFVGSGYASFGTSTNNDLKITTNNLHRLSITAAGNVGIATATPQKLLHVSGSLQLDNELSLGGTATTPGSAGISGQVLKSNGPGAAPSWQTLAGVPNATGTVIAVNGQFLVAQEISVQMTVDYTIPGNSLAMPIGNLTNEIIDNENQYTGSSNNNSFSVSTDGVYLITMNVQLYTTNGTIPVIGIWDSLAGNWVARVNDYYSAPTNQLQTYTLITSIPMYASTTYSFRVVNTADTVIRAHSVGTTGVAPITQMTVRRLR